MLTLHDIKPLLIGDAKKDLLETDTVMEKIDENCRRLNTDKADQSDMATAQSNITALQASITLLQGIHNSRMSAKLSAAQTIANSTLTKVTFNVEEYDNLSEYDAVTNFRFQPVVAGYYHVTAQINYGQQFNDQRRLTVHILKTGTQVRENGQNTSLVTIAEVNCSGDIFLQTTDYIEIWVHQNNGGNVNLDNTKCFLDIHRIA